MNYSVSANEKSGNVRERENAAEIKEKVLREITEAIRDDEIDALIQEGIEAGTLAAKEEVLVRLRDLFMGKMTQTMVGTDRGYQGPYARCPECDQRARFKRHDPKRYLLVTGEAVIERSLYECECGHRWRPLDSQWQLPSGYLSCGVERIVSLAGALVPFAAAENLLWETAYLSVGATTIRNTTEGIGTEMEEEIEAEMAAADRDELPAMAEADVLAIGADGVMVNTREEGWKETKVGRVLRYQRTETGQLKLERSAYVAHLGSVEAFRPKLDLEIRRHGGHGREVTLFLGDGAPWIWNTADEYAPYAIQVLDYYHLCEHVHKAAKVFYGEESPLGQRWAKRICEDYLRQSRVGEAIAKINETGNDSDEHQEARGNLLGYIEANKSRMPYAEMEAKGYPIGSGSIESACKQIVTKRHKQAGMRWSRSGAQKMLTVAAHSHSKRWDEFWARRNAA